MNAQERAARIEKYNPMSSGERMMIEQEIKDAERDARNAALNEAARLLEAETFVTAGERTRAKLQELMEKIRALKTP